MIKGKLTYVAIVQICVCVIENFMLGSEKEVKTSFLISQQLFYNVN